MNSFGERLKFLRQRKDMSLEDLAQAINSTKSTLSKYERGIVLPNLDSASDIAKYFGVTVDWLTGSGDINSKEYNLIGSKELEELREYPKAFIVTLKKAINAGFTPEEFDDIIDLAIKFRKK